MVRTAPHDSRETHAEQASQHDHGGPAIDLASADDGAVVLTRCASLRHWDRDVRA
jgi:hypothetical protein